MLSVQYSACIFATKSSRELWGSAEHSKPRSYFLRLRDVYNEMRITKVFSRLGRTQAPGRENSKPLGLQ